MPKPYRGTARLRKARLKKLAALEQKNRRLRRRVRLLRRQVRLAVAGHKKVKPLRARLARAKKAERAWRSYAETVEAEKPLRPWRIEHPEYARIVKGGTRTARTKSPRARGRAKRRVRAALREIRENETREEFRSKLNDLDRSSFDRLSIKQQRRLLEVTRVYPDSIPQDLPDPFVGPNREILWRLSYSTRAGIRLRGRA
jgi:hypothetical protein